LALISSLSKETIEKYNKDGIIKISLPSEIVELQNEFLLDCCKFLKKWANFETTPEKLTFDLVELSKINRNIVGKLYKVSKRFRSSRALSCHPYFTEIAKALMNTEIISCYHLSIVRIDLPNEEKFLMPPHQDFPYIQGSVNGLTLYLTFDDITPKHGVVSIKRGTHHNGIMKVTESDSRLSSAQTEYVSTGNSSKKIQSTDKVCEISDMSQINNLHFEQEPLSKNESYFFHTLLLHSSEKNTSDSARITMQIRFDDLLCEDSFNRNFPEGRNRDDLFSNNFSEYVVEN
jgi:hypothetical protein